MALSYACGSYQSAYDEVQLKRGRFTYTIPDRTKAKEQPAEDNYQHSCMAFYAPTYPSSTQSNEQAPSRAISRYDAKDSKNISQVRLVDYIAGNNAARTRNARVSNSRTGVPNDQ